MKGSPVFSGEVKEGRLFFRNKPLFLAHLKELDGEVEITVKQHYRRRSDRENRYYWGVIVPILAQHFGYTKDEMHEAIKLQFLKKERENAPATIGSTSVLDTADFEDLMSKIREWASIEYGVYIPLPNEGIEQLG